ncbi:MAG: hypothetical protein WD205_08935, partial [Rhodothermales bacterium]
MQKTVLMQTRYRIQFPRVGLQDHDQDEAYFYLIEGDRKLKLRLHDYDQIYLRPGLYEQVVYERLKCSSPRKVGEILDQTLEAVNRPITELRVLDLGAGNGAMGAVLKGLGVSRLVGADIIPEAKDAAIRDRPDVYDQFYVADFTHLDADTKEEIGSWSINCLTAVAALGFGDIPLKAFSQALSFVEIGGWVAFNIKDTFLDRSDTSGFSTFIRELIFSEYLDIHHMEKYRHRLSMEGEPLSYFALAARKTADIPADFTERIDNA